MQNYNIRTKLSIGRGFFFFFFVMETNLYINRHQETQLKVQEDYTRAVKEEEQTNPNPN